MKNRLFILAAIIITAVTTITVVSCKKDKTEEGNTNETVAENLIPSEEEDIDNTEAYLLSFKEKLQNATKGSETISLEQGSA